MDESKLDKERLSSYKDLPFPEDKIKVIFSVIEKFYNIVSLKIENKALPEDEQELVKKHSLHFLNLYDDISAQYKPNGAYDLSRIKDYQYPSWKYVVVSNRAQDLYNFFDPKLDDAKRPHLSRDELGKSLNIMLGLVLTFPYYYNIEGCTKTDLTENDIDKLGRDRDVFNVYENITPYELKLLWDASKKIAEPDRQYALITELGIDLGPLLDFERQLECVGDILDANKILAKLRQYDTDKASRQFETLDEQFNDFCKISKDIELFHRTIELLNHWPKDIAINIAMGSGYISKDIASEPDKKRQLLAIFENIYALPDKLEAATKNIKEFKATLDEVHVICPRESLQSKQYIEEMIKHVNMLDSFLNSANRFYKAYEKQIDHALSELDQNLGRDGLVVTSPSSERYTKKDKEMIRYGTQSVEMMDKDGSIFSVDVKIKKEYCMTLGKGADYEGLFGSTKFLPSAKAGTISLHKTAIVEWGVQMMPGTKVGPNAHISTPEHILSWEKPIFLEYLDTLYKEYVRSPYKWELKHHPLSDVTYDVYLNVKDKKTFWEWEKTPPVSLRDFRLWALQNPKYKHLYENPKPELVIGGSYSNNVNVEATGTIVAHVSDNVEISGKCNVKAGTLLCGIDTVSDRDSDQFKEKKQQILAIEYKMEYIRSEMDKMRREMAALARQAGPDVFEAMGAKAEYKIDKDPLVEKIKSLNAEIEKLEQQEKSLYATKESIMSEVSAKLLHHYGRTETTKFHDLSTDHHTVIIVKKPESFVGFQTSRIPNEFKPGKDTPKYDLKEYVEPQKPPPSQYVDLRLLYHEYFEDMRTARQIILWLEEHENDDKENDITLKQRIFQELDATFEKWKNGQPDASGMGWSFGLGEYTDPDMKKIEKTLKQWEDWRTKTAETNVPILQH